MAKSRTTSTNNSSHCKKEKKKSNLKLKIVVEKLQRSLLLGRSKSEDDVSGCVPEDVKEGHFAVIAVDRDDEPKRFVVALSYLTHPTFLKLLEQAAEEYGFDNEGALTIPCHPSELQKILDNWASCKSHGAELLHIR